MPADARAGVEDAFDRLLNHANLPGQHAERCSGQQSLAWGFRNASAANLPALAEDLLEALQVVGRHLAAHQSDDSERLRLRAAYAASCALSDGLLFRVKTGSAAPQLDLALAKLAFALEQLLAGDVEDLLEGFPERA